MKFNKVYENDLETIYPVSSNISLNKMLPEQKKNYLSIYNLYRKLFTEYMIKKLKLKKYDEIIEKSKLDFISNKEEDMDIYQYFSSNILKYFYIRNNIYIEKLNKEEINFFKQKIKNKNYLLDNESLEMIKQTYKKVIFENVKKNDKICKILYGPDSSSFFADNNAIVIGFRYDEFAENELNDDEWDKLHKKQIELSKSLIHKMKENLNANSRVPIEILKYSEFSVIPRKTIKTYKKTKEKS